MKAFSMLSMYFVYLLITKCAGNSWCLPSFRMKCRECPKDVDDFYHDLCRGHSYCARGPQYFAAPCVVCEEVWERARDLDEPQEAMRAFDSLKAWIVGFRKNSRNRLKGMDHFYSREERDAYQELNVIHTNLKEIAKADAAAAKAKVSYVGADFALQLGVLISDMIRNIITSILFLVCANGLTFYSCLSARVPVVLGDMPPRRPLHATEK